MLRRILSVFLLMSVIFLVGCSKMPALPGASSTPGYDIVRKSELGDEWQMYQLKVELDRGEELPILLKLVNGDKVDGYFYVDKGSGLDFQIKGASEIYQFDTPVAGRVLSDRFSFTATQAQGNMYILNLRNSSGDKDTKLTVFLEVIYPASGSIYIPLEDRK